MHNAVASWLDHTLTTATAHEIELFHGFLGDPRVDHHPRNGILVRPLKLSLSKEPSIDSFTYVDKCERGFRNTSSLKCSEYLWYLNLFDSY
jgi:hypothetical protein